MKMKLGDKIAVIKKAMDKAEGMMDGLKSCEDQQGKAEYIRQRARYIALGDVLRLLEHGDSVLISI